MSTLCVLVQYSIEILAKATKQLEEITENRPITGRSHTVSELIPRRLYILMQGHLHIHVHCSTYNSQKLENLR